MAQPVKAGQILRDIGELTLDTLIVLGRSLAPWNAADYCARCGVAPLQIRTDWAVAALQLRESAEHTNAAEWASRIAALVDSVYAAVEEARHGDTESGWLALDVARPLVTNALLRVLKSRFDDTVRLGIDIPVYKVSYLLLVTLLLVDERLKESTRQTAIADRWWELFQSPVFAALDEVEERAALAFVGGGALALRLLVFLIPALKRYVDTSPFLHLGYDAPAVAGLEETQAAARRSVVAFFVKDFRVFTSNDYLAFDEPEAHFAHRPISIAVVPVTRLPSASLPDLTGPAHGGGVYVQASANVHYVDEILRDGASMQFSLLADGGVLFPTGGTPKLSAGATGSFGGELRMTYERPAVVDAPSLAQPHGDNVDDDDDPRGVSFTIRRTVAEARATLQELSFRLDLEGSELRIGKIAVLEYVLPDGIRIAFDFGCIAYVRDSGEWGARLRGGLGAEVVIPLDLQVNVGFGDRVSLLKARVRNIHLRVDARGRSEHMDEGSGGLRIDITADLSVVLFGILTVHVDGAGFALRAAASQPGGNLAGIADVGWETVWPTGVGVELRCWKIQGAGYFFYEPAAKRLGGAAEIAIGSWFQLKGIGVMEPTPDGKHQSWVAVATLEDPRAGGLFQWKGVGFLYGSRRTTDPDAFLEGVRTGDLDAILFPNDPVGNASAYVAALGRLFPIADDGEVVGILCKVGALGSRITASIGLLIDGGRQPRLYLIAQFRAVFPTEDIAAVRINADGVAVWDSARDEFQLRIVLRNSKLWGGELTGEAMIFRGDPDHDDGRDQRVTLISIGGFHPAYTMPGAALRVPARLALTVGRGDHLRIEVKAYLAITPGAFHFGLEALLQARFAGFGIRGRLGIDALIGRDQMDISIHLSVELQLGSRTLAGAAFEGQLVGWAPVALKGRVCFKFLFWEWCSPRFTLPLVDGDDLPPQPDVAGRLEAAMRDPRSWDNGGAPGLTLRAAERPGVWLSPSAPLRFTQDVVPLGRSITHFDGGKLAAAATFTVEPVRAATDHWSVRTVEGEFAPVLYFDLTPEQRLAAHAFDVLPAGFELTCPLEAGAAIEADLTYEDLTIDSANPPTRVRDLSALDPTLWAAGMTLAPEAATTYYRSRKTPLTMRRERFAVIDDTGAAVAHDLDFTAAHGRSSGRRYHVVVPMTELA